MSLSSEIKQDCDVTPQNKPYLCQNVLTNISIQFECITHYKLKKSHNVTCWLC